MELPKSLEKLVEEFMKYPGVGRKTAERYAMFTISKQDKEDVSQFADALLNAKEKMTKCHVCGHLTDVNPCSICTNLHRDRSKLMIVENPKDIFTLENSGYYKGMYHVLNGALSPMNGVGPNEINLSSLWPRIHEDEIKEIIIATSATQEGEATAMYIYRVLKEVDVLVTRIGYGVPVGTNLEYADDLTLSKAIENRRKF